MYMPIPENWLESLHLASRKGKDLIVAPEQAAGLAYAHVISDALKAGVSGVFCMDGSPCAALVVVSADTPDIKKDVRSLYKILWNQGEFAYLLLLYPDEIVIHTFSTPPNTWDDSPSCDEKKPSPTWLETLRIAHDAIKIGELVTGIESGRFLEEKPECFNADTSVDATLIGDLAGLRKLILEAEEGDTKAAYQVTESIHAVLLQMLFLRYLEDRGILTKGYIHTHGNAQCDTLHALLKKVPKDFCRLLKQLDTDLNGGLFVDDPLWEKQAELLAEFLEGKTNFATGQKRLLSLYQFNHIPVELLSEIYDRFLHAPQEQKQRGAYYTPRRLAALVVDQIWESLRAELNKNKFPRVLDPACGSGIFLAILFQRMASHLGNPSWETSKKIATALHGLDVDTTAIRISAFSLSLALLNNREPKELQERLETETHILPELFGKTLLAQDFFQYPKTSEYDYIIGNPPWGSLSIDKGNTGEQWLAKQKEYPESPNKERSWPFIWKSCQHLPREGVLALLLPSTGFYLNNTSKSLKRLLHNVRLERLVDLSDLRHVAFKGVDAPPCILCARRVDEAPPHHFEYIGPKADLNAVRGERVLLSPQDYSLLTAWAFANDAKKVTQRAMWCSPIEQKLFQFLDTLPTLKDLPILETKQAREKFPSSSRPDWGMGLGFQSYQGKGKYHDIDAPSLYASIDTRTRWVPIRERLDSSNQNRTLRVVRKNYTEGFSAPHIVIPRSLAERLKATYAEFDFSFETSLFAITVPNTPKNCDEGKFLTAFLNSSFVGWYMATSLGLAVYRPRFTPSLILSLPFPKPEDLPNEGQARAARAAVISKMNDLMQQTQAWQSSLLRPQQTFPTGQDIEELDTAIFDYLGLRPEEIAAISDYIEYTRKATQPNKGSAAPDTWLPSDARHWVVYCSWLSKSLTESMSDKTTRAYAAPCAYTQDIVVVQIERQHGSHGVFPAMSNAPAQPLQQLHPELLQTFERHLGGNIYLQRDALIFENHKIYLIKPRQRRFWLTGAAYADADRIIAHLLEVGQNSGALYE